jgi:hypothetical protein
MHHFKHGLLNRFHSKAASCEVALRALGPSRTAAPAGARMQVRCHAVVFMAQDVNMSFSLDVMLAASDSKGLVGDIKSEMAAAVDSLRKKRGKGGGADRTAAKEVQTRS